MRLPAVCCDQTQCKIEKTCGDKEMSAMDELKKRMKEQAASLKKAVDDWGVSLKEVIEDWMLPIKETVDALVEQAIIDETLPFVDKKTRKRIIEQHIRSKSGQIARSKARLRVLEENKDKSNNWKRMHGLPAKRKC